MRQFISYENGIHALDSGYVRPHLAAIHLIVEAGRVALVDSGTSHAVPGVQAALAELNLGPEAVDFVILTHVHLDHAGGAGALMRAFPCAKLVVHPRGARHMIDPARLIAGTQAVYGIEATERLYGEIVPVDAARVIEATDALTLSLAGRELLCLDTPGHARHHIAIVDHGSGGIFAGDNFGVSYRELDSDGRQFVFPTTTPVQFEPEAMHATIDRLLEFSPPAVYLTHFGQLRDVAARAADLHRQVAAQVAIAVAERDAGAERHARIREGLAALLREELQHFDGQLPMAAALELYANDLELNAQGLGVWLDTQGRN